MHDWDKIENYSNMEPLIWEINKNEVSVAFSQMDLWINITVIFQVCFGYLSHRTDLDSLWEVVFFTFHNSRRRREETWNETFKNVGLPVPETWQRGNGDEYCEMDKTMILHSETVQSRERLKLWFAEVSLQWKILQMKLRWPKSQINTQQRIF